jgi:hypothetical protein
MDLSLSKTVKMKDIFCKLVPITFPTKEAKPFLKIKRDNKLCLQNTKKTFPTFDCPYQTNQL